MFWIHFSCKCRFFSPWLSDMGRILHWAYTIHQKKNWFFCEEINWWKKERCVAAFLALDWSFYLLFFCSRASPRGHKEALLRTLSSLLSVLFYQTTWSEFFQKVSIKRPGPSQKKSIVLFYFRAATANFWSLLNNLVWIFGKSLY